MEVENTFPVTERILKRYTVHINYTCLMREKAVVMSKEICVIGAGIGGLMAGALLAKEGNHVTVIEKATKVGGSAGSYIRKKHTFPAGATIAFGLEEHGLLDELFTKLEMNIAASMLDHPMDVVLADRIISVYQDKVAWKKELARVFHERSQDVLAFWNKLERIGEAVHGVTATGVSLPIQHFYDFGTLPKHAVSHPKSMVLLARYATRTVNHLLRTYKLDTYVPFRQFLDAQLLDAAQTDCTKAALLPSSLALTIYRRGSFYVERGMAQLSEALAERIVELGGEVFIASEAKALTYDKEKWYVTSRKRSGVYDVVINNTGTSFGIGTSHSEADEFAWGAYRIDALLIGKFLHDKLNGKKLPFALQIVPSKEHKTLQVYGYGPIYVTFQSAYDENNNLVEDEVMMTCSIHTESEQWASLTKENYQLVKKELFEAMFTEVEAVIPINEYLLYSEAGTPITYKKYIGKLNVGGFPLTVKNAIIKPKSIKSSLPQLYIAGEQSFPGPGTLSSALSGFHIARAIMKTNN